MTPLDCASAFAVIVILLAYFRRRPTPTKEQERMATILQLPRSK